MRRVGLLVAFVSFALALLAFGKATVAEEPQAAKKETEAPRTLVFVVKHTPVSEVAKALSDLFAGDNRVYVVPEPISGCLLIRTAPDVAEQVIALVEKLDRPPHTIALQIILLRTPPGRAKKEEPLRELAELSGKTAAVEEKIRELERRGELIVVNRVQLTTLENQQAMVQASERKPAATGGQTVRPGVRATSYTYMDVGIIAQVTPRVSSEGKIAVAVNFEKSELEPADEKAQPDQDPVPPRTGQMTTQTTISVPDGESVVVGGVITTNSDRSEETLVIISARILDPRRE